MRRSRVALALLTVVLAVGVVAVPALVDDAPRAGDPDRDPVTPPRTLATDADGRATALAAAPGTPLLLGGADPVAAATAFTDRYGDDLGLDDSTLRLLSATPRLDGGTAVRFQQEVDGIPVLGGEVAVQVDDRGGVLSGNADVAGPIAPGPVLVGPDEAAATARAVAARATGATAEQLTVTPRGRWLYDPAVLGDDPTFGPRLTWRYEVTATVPVVRHEVLVDAASGAVVVAFSQLPHGGDRQVCDTGNVVAATTGCTTPARVEGDEATGIAQVDAAYTHSGATRDWFLDLFGRDGVDGVGSPVRTTVRHCRSGSPCPYANAYWDGSRAVFGDGYATDDVTAHELAHGVTEFTAGLFYWQQSGAINEAMSDVFGELVDLATPGDDDAGDRWLIGEDLPNGAIRDMADPTTRSDPDSMTSPLFYSGDADAGGVHSNSGVANHAAVLLVDGGTFGGHTVAALGPTKVAAVFYEALTAHLTSAADYADLHAALPQACRNLVGVGGWGITEADCGAVDEAVAAVAMDHVPAGQPADAPVCTAGTGPAVLLAEDFEGDLATTWSRTRAGASFWNWVHPVPAFARFATSGTQNLWGATTGDPWNNGTAGTVGEYGDSRIAMTGDVVVPTEGPAYLRFDHAFGFEASTASGALRYWDGGVVEYSTDGGATWSDLGARFDHNGYTGTLNAPGSSPNPLWGRSAFVGSSRGMTASRADLGDLAGQSVRFRFRVAEDEVVGSYGWYVDDVSVYTCPRPDLAVELTADQATVTAGEAIDLHVTLTNTGNVTLTDLAVVDDELVACAGPLADLAPGADVTVDCDRPTVDPDDVGIWSHATAATAAELDGPVTSAPVEVEVLAPGTPDLTVGHDAGLTEVARGGAVPLTVHLHNTGDVTLTAVVVEAPDAPDCAGALGTDLAPGAEVDLTCEHTPTALGPFTSTVSVTAAELAAPTTATTPAVEVVDGTHPTATLTVPADGALYEEGATVLADFDCGDDQPGVTCTAPVTDGAPIDTTVGTHTFTVVAVDAAGNDHEVGHTYTVARRRPDARVRLLPTGTERGDGVYNDSGSRQAAQAGTGAGRTVTIRLVVENDGTHAEALAVRGGRSTANYRVRYLAGTTDVTALVGRGAYRTPVLAPGAERVLRIQVTVTDRAPAGSRIERAVTVRSTSDPGRLDVARFTVRRQG